MEFSHAFHRQSETLWAKALDGIKPELRELIDGKQSDKRVVLEAVLSAAEQKREACIRKQWRIKKRNGDVIIMRDVFEKIVQCVNKFKELGNAVTQISPHASVPWGMIVVLLQTGINDTEAFATMVDGLEVSTSIIARCAILESVHLQQPTSATSHLKSALIALYGAVLTFLGTPFEYFCTNTAKRFLKALIDPAKEIEDAIKDVEAKQSEVDRTAQIISMEIINSTSTRMLDLTSMVSSLAIQLEVANSKLMSLKHEEVPVQREASVSPVITSIMGPKQRMVKISGFKDDLDVEERTIRHDWLSSIRYQYQHRAEVQDRMPNSGQWLFQRSEFLCWTDSSISGTLWLHGPPGCGKTKLASAVIDFNRARAETQAGVAAPIAYFYCNAGDSERTQPSEILRCIARQLCGDDPNVSINQDLNDAYVRADIPGIGQNKLSIEDTMALILKTLSDNPATIVIDALDELNADDWYQLWDCLDTIVKDSPNVVKVFLTSRRDKDIVCRLRSTPNIYVSVQENRLNIERFTKLEVDNAVARGRLLQGVVSEPLRWDIINAINQGSQGTFRWVTLQVQNLCDDRRIKFEADVRHELLQLPQSLFDLYVISFNQMAQLSAPRYDLAVSTLQLMLVAVRPISWAEILHLLQVSHSSLRDSVSREELLEITYNFIADDAQREHPRLAHHSVREYLTTRAEFTPGVSHAKAAEVCIRHILAPGHTSTQTFCYSTFYMGTHLSATCPEDRLSIQSCVEKLLLPGTFWPEPSQLFRTWRERLDELIKANYLCCGGYDSAHQCRETIISVTPLAAVCAMGLVEMIPYFHPSHDELFHNAGIPDYQAHLTFEGIQAIDACRGKSCMLIAVILNHHDIVTWVHSLGFSVDAPLESGETALLFAVMMGNPGMVKRLLDEGADPNRAMLKPNLWEMPLQRTLQDTVGVTGAGEKPDEAPNTIIRNVRSSMGFHVRNDQGGIEVQSPFHTENETYPILYLAMHTDRGDECVELLLRSGADINARTSRNITVLEYFLDYVNPSVTFEVFSVLLRWKVEVDAKLQYGRTIAHIVAAMGHAELMERLLDAGANCVLRDRFAQSPLDITRRYGHQEMEKLLVSRGAIAPPAEDDDDDNIFLLRPRSSSLSQMRDSAPQNPSISIQDYDAFMDLRDDIQGHDLGESDGLAISTLTGQPDSKGTSAVPQATAGPRLDVKKASRRKSFSDSWKKMKAFSGLKKS